MAKSNPPGISDLLGLFGGANPLNAITKSIGQFQRGVSDFLSAVENFNKTMEQLHGVADRVNGLLDTVEGPIRAFVPQVTKVVNAADSMVEQLSGPIDRVAPGLVRLGDLLSSPQLTTLPTDLGEFMAALSELAHKLQPLGQMAESAGSLFGLRPFASMLGSAPPPPAPQSAISAASDALTPAPPVKKAAVKKAAVKKAAVKKAAVKKTATEKASPVTTAAARKR